MRRVLIVSPRFPPVNAPDVHRVRHSLPYFKEFGWEPLVLAVVPDQCEAPLDPLLSRTVPEGTRVEYARAIDIRLTRRFSVGNLEIRTIPYISRLGSHLLRTERIDLVYFSTTAFSVAALGRRWKQRYGVPFVIDLQDPWLNFYHDQPEAPEPPGGRLKYGLSRAMARVLEPYTMKRVDHVIAVSPAYPELLANRYPAMRADQFTVLPFGASAADFDLVQKAKVSQAIFDKDDGFVHWVYTGAAGEIMHFALRAFFAALKEARTNRPEFFDRLRIHFVGTDYALDRRLRKTVEPIAVECGVRDLVVEHPRRIPYFEALRCLSDADALIVLGSDDPGYTASKLYPYILAGKPMLAIFHQESSVVNVLRETRAARVVAFDPSSDHTGTTAGRVQEEWFVPGAWSIRPETDWEAFSRYSAREMTRRQCDVFDQVTRAANPS